MVTAAAVVFLVVTLVGAGFSISHAARVANIPRRTAGNIWARNGNPKPRRGRPSRKITPRDSRRIARHIYATQAAGGTSLPRIKALLGLGCSIRTIGRDLRAQGFRCYSRLEKGVLTQAQRAAPLPLWQ